MSNRLVEAWINSAPGRYMNPDGAFGMQCKDVPDDEAVALFGNWVNTLRPGNANQAFANASPSYYTKVANNPADPNQVPPRGAVLTTNGWPANPYGHIMVVVSADTNGVTVIEQNYGSTPTLPARTHYYSWSAFPFQGWLIPKVADDPPPAPPAAALSVTQRQVGSSIINGRKGTTLDAEIVETFNAGAVLNLKAWTHGQSVDGNDIWMQGAISGLWVWSGGLTDAGTHNLIELKQETAIAANQRVATAGVNIRKTYTTSSEALGNFVTGDVLTFDAWSHGESIDGNDIWLRGAFSGGWVWTGGLNTTSVDGLVEIKLNVPGTKDDTSASMSIRPAFGSFGIDISSFNGTIDFSTIEKYVDFFIVRNGHTGESYGGDKKWNSDPMYNSYKASITKPMGSYRYIYFALDPEVEATNFVESCSPLRDSESLWVDLEDTANANEEWLRKFIDKVEALSKKQCHIYTYSAYFNQHLWINKFLVNGRKLWLANYKTPVAEGIFAADLNTKAVMWQYSSKGQLMGSTHDLDLNVYYGNIDEFKKLGDTIKAAPSTDYDKENNTLLKQLVASFAGFKATLESILDKIKSIFK